MKKITAHDIARIAGVSPSTVSRALNNSARVDEQTRQLILETAKRLGFPVRRRQENLTIGVIGQFQTGHLGGYFGVMLCAIYEEISKRGGHVELVSRQDVSLLNERAIWGAINFSARPLDQDKWYDSFGVPLVNINQPADPAENIGAVSTQDENAIHEAIDLLWEKGHRKIAYFSVENRQNEAAKTSRRLQAYETAMHKHGATQLEKYMFFSSYANMEKDFLKLIDNGFSAVLFPYEIANLHLEPFLRKYRIRVPEDISIVQWEFSIVSEVLSPPRSTIYHDYHGVAREAVALLYDMILHKAPARSIFVPSSFRNRESISDKKATGKAKVVAAGKAGIQKRILSLLASGMMSSRELADALSISTTNGNFRRNLKNLLDQGVIAFENPNTPNSRNQRYRISGY